MPLTVATNPQTQETLVLVDNQWKPATQVAAHGDTGEKAYLVDNQWLTESGADKLPPAPTPRGPVGRAVDAGASFLQGVGDVGETLGSGAVAPVVAGALGAGQAVTNVYRRAGHALAPDLIDAPSTEAADVVNETQDALTHRPVTQGGREYTEAVTYPLTKLAQGADIAGQKTAEVTGSPALGAGVNAALQMAPSVILPELSGKGPLGARIAARAASRAGGTVAPPGAGAAPGGSAAAVGAAGGEEAAAAARAEAYVRDRVGMDWNSLSAGLKDTITTIAKDSQSLDALDPKAVARKARLDAAQMPATRGQVTRDLSQLTKEENLVKSEAGAPIREVKAAQDARFADLIDKLRQDTGTKAATRSQAGRSVQDTALRGKARASKSNYDALYKKARETEPEAKVSPDPMYEFVRGNPEVLNPAIQHLNWLQGWLKKAGIEKEVAELDAEGNPTGESSTERRPIKLSELDDLRKKALSIAKGGGDSAHYAGEVIKAIDQSFEEVPEAAKAWKAARDAFKAHKLEFEDTGILKKLGTDKSRIDRRVALADTIDTIVRSDAEDIVKLKKGLLEGGTPETKAAGAQAWKDVQAGVIDYLKEAATGKREIGNEEGVLQFNSSFRNAFNELDKDGKIEEIFSPEQVKRLRDINQLVHDVRTTPSGRVAGSDTVPRLVSMLDKVADLPGVGKYVKPAAEAVKKYADVKSATTDPLASTAKKATRRAGRAAAKGELQRAAPLVAPSIGEALKNQPQQ